MHKAFWGLVLSTSLAVVTLGSAQVASSHGDTLTIADADFFPEGVAVDAGGNFYVGSMMRGDIMRVRAGQTSAEPFIAAGANGLVSVLGVYADDAHGLLWACSSDAGNGKLAGSAPVGIKSFDLGTGEAVGSYDLPDGGFCNDLTVDEAGNLYATDSWSPRILRLPAGGDALEVWLEDEAFGPEQWSLNGIDVRGNVLYTVNQLKGLLFRVDIAADGSPSAPTLIETSQPLRRPDGLKILSDTRLATAEGGAGGMALLTVSGGKAEVAVVSEGLNGVSTFAHLDGKAWLLENQGQHFWDPEGSGPEANLPFRIVEVPLETP